jgi:hypothetical protein
VESSQQLDIRIDFAARTNRTVPPLAGAPMAMTRVGRSRPVRPNVARVPQGGDPRDADVAMSPDNRAGHVRSTALRDAARQTLVRSGNYLLADARNACRLEGVIATRQQLLMRVAKRVGLPQAEVARGLAGSIRRDAAASAPGGVDAGHLRDRVSQLAATILGTREREVFLARREARPDDIPALHELACSLGLSAERVYELEASARRKVATALR